MTALVAAAGGALASWWHTGAVAVTPFGALGGVACLFAAVFLTKLFTVPITIAQEERERFLALKSEGERGVTASLNRLEVARLLSAAEHCKNLCASPDPVSDETIELWHGDCMAVLGVVCGEEAIHSFKSDANTSALVLTSPIVPQRNKELWSWLNKRIGRLDLIYQAMPRA